MKALQAAALFELLAVLRVYLNLPSENGQCALPNYSSRRQFRRRERIQTALAFQTHNEQSATRKRSSHIAGSMDYEPVLTGSFRLIHGKIRLCEQDLPGRGVNLQGGDADT